jgi:photosystem II stability/assembly factor-like uncharacterized protein
MRTKMLALLGLLVILAAGAVSFLVNSAHFRTKLHANQTEDGDSNVQRADKGDVEVLERVGNAPEDEAISRIQFIDETHGWVSDQKRVWRTLDGGYSWQLIYESPSDPIWRVQFTSSSKGWILVHGKMYSTVDAGETWTPFNQPISPYPEGDLANFRFQDDGTMGWVIGGVYRAILPSDEGGPPTRYARPGFEDQGRVGAIFTTRDSGKTWQRQLLTSRWGYLWNLFVLDVNHAWVTGIPGEFYLDKGRWKEMDHRGEDEYGEAGVKALNLAPGGPDEEPSCIFFLNPDQGWVCNFNGHVARSLDGGRTWEDLFEFDDGSQILSYFWDLYFSDSTQGWALSHQGDVYRTMDGGRHWSKLNTGIKATALFFLKPNYGLIIAKEGLFRLRP